MHDRCAFRLRNGKFCRRWPVKGTQYCLGHTRSEPRAESQEIEENLSPLETLNTHEDVFDVVRETLNAVRLGRITPGCAYATGYFVDLWLRVHERMEKAGPDTRRFQRRRLLSNPVEQAMFDVVTEKVVQLMTGRTVEEIERNHGALNAPDEPHWTEQRVSVELPSPNRFSATKARTRIGFHRTKRRIQTRANSRPFRKTGDTKLGKRKKSPGKDENDGTSGRSKQRPYKEHRLQACATFRRRVRLPAA